MQGTGDGTVIQTIARLPGMSEGEVGLAGVDRPGPTIKTVAVPAWQYIGIEIGWSFLNNFFGLLTIDGLGLAELAAPGDAFQHLYKIAGIALAPTALMLLKELYDYFGKVRAARI